jgi:hypothetical protein
LQSSDSNAERGAGEHGASRRKISGHGAAPTAGSEQAQAAAATSLRHTLQYGEGTVKFRKVQIKPL